MNFRILRAILAKDVRSLLLLVLMTTLLFAGDVLIQRFDPTPLWGIFRIPLLLLTGTALIYSVFQLDSPVSMVDDWLCRPVPRKELLVSKLLLLLSVIYLSRVIAMFAADLVLGLPLAESLQEALLLQDADFQLLLPVLLLIAMVTQTLVQGVGVVVAIFVCIFVIPTPLIRPPGPLNPGIGEYLVNAGLDWLAMTPAKVLPIIIVAFACGLLYWRRRVLQARILLALTVCVTLLFMLLPTWLMPWKSVFALQTTFARADGAPVDTRNIKLRNPRVCFPATRVGDLATDTAFEAARQHVGPRMWPDQALREFGPDAVTFLTDLDLGGLPIDWRVKLNFVQANYLSSGRAPLYSLRPYNYFNDNTGGSAFSHLWLLPKFVVQRLESEKGPSLELTYSLTMLKPRNFTLPTDGSRHKLPGVGYCGATVDAAGNSIDIDCFSAFGKPAQITAELTDIPASRSYDRVDFAPRWTQSLYSQRVNLAIGSPRLASHDTITLTAWDVAGYLEKSVTLPGILGAGAETCPLPRAGGNNFQNSRWRDAAPHEAQSITVDAGVQLEVLDFGGTGSPIVLLPGLGATAHSFDELAPLLAQKHRVVAITRRGTGYSSRPDFGFDTPRLAKDVLQVMDAMGLDKVVLAGHSIAGDELTWLGAHDPDRFSALIYMDAAYDRSGDGSNTQGRRLRELNRSLSPEPPIPPEATLNFTAMTKFLAERGHVRLPEGELIAFYRMNSPYLAGTPSIDARTQQAIKAALQKPDYAAVKIPALAIYAFEDPDEPLPPWYDANDKELLAKIAEIARINDALKRDNIEAFRHHLEKGQVLELRNATHYLFQSNQQQVLEAIEEFAAK